MEKTESFGLGTAVSLLQRISGKARLEELTSRSPSVPEAASEAFSGLASPTLRCIFEIAVGGVIGPAFTLCAVDQVSISFPDERKLYVGQS